MEGGGGELQCWDKLSPDLLGLIFIKLSLLELLTVIPSVCKSWGKVVSGPYCWKEIDIIQWSREQEFNNIERDHGNPNGLENIDRMLKMLIARSCGYFCKLAVCNLSSDSMLSFIADHATCLQILELPGSKISDSIVEQVVVKLSTITFLDVSDCTNIGSRALRAIGTHCKSLVGLRRVMGLWEDDEAHAIAATMTKLRHLEICSPSLTTEGVVEILSSCQELEFLDVRRCLNVMLDEKFLNDRCSSGLKVLVPNDFNNFDESDWDDYYFDYIATYGE